MYNTLNNFSEFETKIQENDFSLVYFSHEQCNVCKVLKPKIAEMIKSEFPKVELLYSDTKKDPETAGQNGIFTVPTVLIFIEGQESIRKSRNIGINELHELLERPYRIMNN